MKAMTRDEMLEAVKPVLRFEVCKMAKKTPASFEELESAALGALPGLLERWSPEMGASFPIYAAHRIRGAMLDYCRELDPLKREGRRHLCQIDQARHAIEQRKMRAASSAEIAAKLGWTPERLAERRLAVQPMESLDDEHARIEKMAGAIFPAPSRREWADVAQLLESAQHVLSPRYRRVLELYYRDELTMFQIGKLMRVNESRISQIHKEALRKLRIELHRRGYGSSADALPRAA